MNSGRNFFVSNSIASYHLGVCSSDYLKFDYQICIYMTHQFNLLKKVLFMNLGAVDQPQQMMDY